MRPLAAMISTAALIASGLATGAAATAVPPAHAGPPPTLGEIAIVPLDDRPFTAVTPVEMAASGGHTALTPDTELLGEFFEYGDADAVGEWWADAAAEAEGSVVAVPMLAYGGLVASRACATDLDTALERLHVLEEVKSEHPDQPIYAFDVIQRLTIEPTSGYPGKYSGPVREWAELMDRVENLGEESLRAAYEEVTASIPVEIREDYLCARARNHEVNLEMVRATAAGTIDFLVLGQDDAGGFGPHRAEKEKLTALISDLGVADRVKVYPGADVLSALLTARLVVERLGSAPTVSVEWSRTPGNEWTAPYQDVPYGHLVAEYIQTLGATESTSADADVLLMANTSGAGSLEPFVDRIHEAVARGRMVAVGDDAVAGVVDAELRKLLVPRIDVGELAGWSGWNVGISLAQSVVRAALLEASRAAPLLAGSTATSGTPVLESRQALLLRAAQAHQRLLFEELVHTDLYRNNIRAEVRQHAVAAGDDPQYMTTSAESANALAVDSTRPLAEELFDEEFAGVPVRLGHDGRVERTAVVVALDSLRMHLGWPRYQELDVFPEIRLAPGDPETTVSVALLPASTNIRPDAEVVVNLVAVLRNHTADPVETTVSLTAPEGWAEPADVTIRMEAFGVADVAVPVVTAKVAPGTSAEVTVTAMAPDGRTDSSSSLLSASWRNLALASSGATASASGWWNQYAPERAIDGNTSGSASRWITEASMPQWLQVTLAEPAYIDTVSLHQYNGYLLEDYAVSVLVEGRWQAVAATAGNTEVHPVISFPATQATAVRLDITKTRDGRARLYEMEVTCRSNALCD